SKGESELPITMWRSGSLRDLSHPRQRRLPLLRPEDPDGHIRHQRAGDRRAHPNPLLVRDDRLARAAHEFPDEADAEADVLPRRFRRDVLELGEVHQHAQLLVAAEPGPHFRSDGLVVLPGEPPRDPEGGHMVRCGIDLDHACRSSRRSGCALMATMMVLSDMSTAPAAGESTMPRDASTPAASGIATMLYPAAHQRFCTILR